MSKPEGPKRRRLLRFLLWSMVATIGLTVLGGFGFNWYIRKNQQAILARIKQTTGLQIDVGTLDVDWRLHRPRIRLEAVNIRSSEFSTKAQSLQLTLRVRESLVQRDLRLREIEINGLEVAVPIILDQPFSEESQTSISVSDVIDHWQRFSQMVDAIVVRNSKLSMRASKERSLAVNLQSLRVAGTDKMGQLAVSLNVNGSGNFSFNGDWSVTDAKELYIVGDAKSRQIPIPLLHVKREDFALVQESLGESECHDFGAIPCMKAQELRGQLDVIVSEKRFAFEVRDIYAKTSEAQSQGSFKISAEDSGVSFDINLHESSGTIQAVLAVLDSEWMGEETYKWLLEHIPGASAEHGSVKIRGRTKVDGFDAFEIGFSAKTPRLEFDSSWPALSELEANVLITSDSIVVSVNNCRFGGFPLKAGKFWVPSFAAEQMIGKVEASASEPVSTFLKSLDRSPIRDIATAISESGEIASDKPTDLYLGLTINFSDFNEQGVDYLVRTSTREAIVIENSKMLGLDRAKLNIKIEGQASPRRNRSRIKGSVFGRSAGKWNVGSSVHARFALDTDLPLMGARLVVGNTPKPVLPRNPGATFDLPGATGFVQINRSGKSNVVAARFRKLHVPDVGSKESIAAKPSSSPTPVVPPNEVKNADLGPDPRTWPALDLEFSDLRYGDLEFGHVKLAAKKQRDGLSEIVGNIKAPRFSAEIDDGDWTKIGSKTESFFRGRLISSDTGTVLKKLDVFDGLNNGRTTLDFDLRWRGAPWQMKPSRASGFLLFKLIGGELLSVDSVFVKLIDVLTLKSLKFYERGSKIEKAQGKVRVADGKLFMDLVDLDLSSSNIKFKGDVDLVNEEIATDVGMEVKIGSAVSLGTVGVVAGPAVALLGYLVADDLELPGFELLNKLTAFSYRLEGPWAEPKVSAFRPKPFGLSVGGK